MMQKELEQKKFVEKLIELATLFLFIILSLLAAVLFVNLVIFPLVIFSTSDAKAFTTLFKVGASIAILGLMLTFIVTRIRYYLSNGIRPGWAILLFLKDRSIAFLSALAITICAGLLVLFIYFVLNFNYYLLYEIIN